MTNSQKGDPCLFVVVLLYFTFFCILSSQSTKKSQLIFPKQSQTDWFVGRKKKNIPDIHASLWGRILAAMEGKGICQGQQHAKIETAPKKLCWIRAKAIPQPSMLAKVSGKMSNRHPSQKSLHRKSLHRTSKKVNIAGGIWMWTPAFPGSYPPCAEGSTDPTSFEEEKGGGWPLKVGENQHKNMLNLQVLPSLKQTARTWKWWFFSNFGISLFPEVYEIRCELLVSEERVSSFLHTPKVELWTWWWCNHSCLVWFFGCLGTSGLQVPFQLLKLGEGMLDGHVNIYLMFVCMWYMYAICLVTYIQYTALVKLSHWVLIMHQVGFPWNEDNSRMNLPCLSCWKFTIDIRHQYY